MESKHQVHNLVILDESGSMDNIISFTINGFNKLLQTTKSIEKEFPEQEHIVSFFTFGANKVRTLHFLDPASTIEEINTETYQPNGNTPLYDAIGFACNKLEKVLISQVNKNYNVLVTILTDGEENASREYNQQDINSLINRLKEENWTFTYIGTEHDVVRESSKISINNYVTFEKNRVSYMAFLDNESSSRRSFSKKIRDKESVKEDFYKSKD